MKFDKDSDKIIVIMYPTGGYGNFMYKVLSDHLNCTVKVDNTNFQFSSTGHSHSTNKYSETFALGKAYYEKKLSSFNYGYQIYDIEAYLQIQQGKKFLILGDTGNLGDNVKFIKKFFPNGKIIRIFADSFEEKFVAWSNCFTKVISKDLVYKNTLLTTQGIAAFTSKHPDEITDIDAVNCMKNFFTNNFGQFGKNYSKKIVEPNVINFAIKSFFTKESFLEAINFVANELCTTLINVSELENLYNNFNKVQTNFLNSNNAIDPLVMQAIQPWYEHKID